MSRLPLPQLTFDNEFFWTSGADGVLRIQGCNDCKALIHPPQPICRYCYSHNVAPSEVSGRAVLSAFTVNHRFSIPGLSAPYVVAQVAIEEDPRVRLTTNIIDCDPEELELGRVVEVVFEQNDDVWLPLFRPTSEPETAPLPDDEIAPTDFPKFVRPMLTTEKFEDTAAITGIGASKLGRRLMVSPLSLTIEASEAAIADAGLTLADIDGLSTYPAIDAMGMGEGGVTALEGALGIRPTWINGGMDTFGPGGSVIAAVMAVATGMARHVLCFRTLWEATFNQLMKEGKLSPPGGTRVNSWQAPFGATSAAHTLALNAQRHFHRYGTTKETLGWIALNQRANAALNPTAIYRDPMSMDDYLNARPITTEATALVGVHHGIHHMGEDALLPVHPDARGQGGVLGHHLISTHGHLDLGSGRVLAKSPAPGFQGQMASEGGLEGRQQALFVPLLQGTDIQGEAHSRSVSPRARERCSAHQTTGRLGT